MPEAALDISDLAFRYPGAERWTVRISKLSLGPGEQVLLSGGSGSGKSTLLYLIAGLMRPTRGTIRVAGVEPPGGARGDLFRGRHIGMIFQTFHLLAGFTPAENVMAALMFSAVPRREHRSRAGELLRRLGVEDASRPAEALSVGQQQRVAVARALACRPELILADEPTASLDPENAAGAIELIQATCRENGAALLCTSHDPSMAARFERRIALATLEAGMPAEERAA